MIVPLSPSPEYTDCSSVATPRSLLLVSSDPECRVSILASPDGSTPGPSVVRVLTPKKTEVTWDASDNLAFVVTAGHDPAPTVTVSGANIGPPT